MQDQLCAHHARSKETCEWVLTMYGDNYDKNNITVTNWIKACREFLEALELDKSPK